MQKMQLMAQVSGSILPSVLGCAAFDEMQSGCATPLQLLLAHAWWLCVHYLLKCDAGCLPCCLCSQGFDSVLDLRVVVVNAAAALRCVACQRADPKSRSSVGQAGLELA
jgi:hypothetical protein